MKIVLFLLLSVIFFWIVFILIQFKRFSSVTRGEKITKYDNPRKALLVMDLQKDLTEKKGKAPINPRQTDEAIENVNNIIARARDKNLIIVYIRHEFQKNIFTDIITRGIVAEGSTGAEMDARVNIVNNNIFVKYVMDTYSNKEFEKFLCRKKIDHIFLTGVDAKACIDRTLKAALKRGYRATVLSDAVATKNGAGLTQKMKAFTDIGAMVTTTKKMLENKV